MSNAASNLGDTVKAMRPMVPTKDYETSKQFYLDLGFQPRQLAERLFEMELGAFSFILQDYYVEDWANNFVMHVLVTGLDRWREPISGLDLPGWYGVKTLRPKQESWRVVAGIVDPCGVLWRFLQAQTSRYMPACDRVAIEVVRPFDQQPAS
jgi:hypothetical protein